MSNQIPILQFVGYKNSGKTTLMSTLIRYCTNEYSFNICAIKHDQHGFELDVKGTDTYKHRKSGAPCTFIVSPTEGRLMLEFKQEHSLQQWISLITLHADYDAVFVEGFKHEDQPKIVLIRSTNDFHLLQELTQIHLVVLQNEEIQSQYMNATNKNFFPYYPHVTRKEEDQLIAFIEDFFIKHSPKK